MKLMKEKTIKNHGDLLCVYDLCYSLSSQCANKNPKGPLFARENSDEIIHDIYLLYFLLVFLALHHPSSISRAGFSLGG